MKGTVVEVSISALFKTCVLVKSLKLMSTYLLLVTSTICKLPRICKRVALPNFGVSGSFSLLKTVLKTTFFVSCVLISPTQNPFL